MREERRDRSRVTIWFPEQDAAFVLAHEPFSRPVALRDRIRARVAAAPVADKVRAVVLDWFDACELRDWLIHARHHYGADVDSVLYQSVSDALIAVVCSLRLQDVSGGPPAWWHARPR